MEFQSCSLCQIKTWKRPLISFVFIITTLVIRTLVKEVPKFIRAIMCYKKLVLKYDAPGTINLIVAKLFLYWDGETSVQEYLTE